MRGITLKRVQVSDSCAFIPQGELVSVYDTKDDRGFLIIWKEQHFTRQESYAVAGVDFEVIPDDAYNQTPFKFINKAMGIDAMLINRYTDGTIEFFQCGIILSDKEIEQIYTDDRWIVRMQFSPKRAFSDGYSAFTANYNASDDVRYTVHYNGSLARISVIDETIPARKTVEAVEAVEAELMIKQLTWLSQDLRLGKVEKIVISEGLPIVHYFAVNVAALETLKLCAIPFHADHYSIAFLNPKHLQATIDLRIEASQENHE